MMELLDALRLSGVYCADREAEGPGEPKIAARNLVGFDDDGEPEFVIHSFTKVGSPISPVISRRYDDWRPIDELDVIDALGNLAGPKAITTAWNKIIDKKREIGIPHRNEGRAFKSRYEAALAHPHIADDLGL
jgi:hypothetical protein